MIVVVLGVIPLMCFMAFIALFYFRTNPAEVLRSLGIGIGAVCGGFATALGALGMFVFGDRRTAPPPAPLPPPKGVD